MEYNSGKVIIINLFSKIKGKLIDKNEDLRIITINYLIQNIGLTFEEVNKLENKLKNGIIEKRSNGK